MALVRLYNAQRKPNEGLAQVIAAFKSQPEDPLVQAAYVEQLMRLEQLAKAADVIRGIQSSYPNSQETQMLVGRFQLSQGNTKEATSVFNKVLALGESQPARHQIARIQLSNRNFEKAEASYRKLIALNPEDDIAYKGLITVFEVQGTTEDGIEELIRLTESTNAVMPKLVLVEFYGRNGNFDDAFGLLRRLRNRYRRLASDYSKHFIPLLLSSNLTTKVLLRADRQFLRVCLIHQKTQGYWLCLLALNWERTTREKQRKFISSLLRLSPNAPILAILAGDIAVANNSLTKAAESYKQAWSRAPSDQVAVKYFAALSRQTPLNNKEVLRFLLDWEAKTPNSVLAKLSKAGYYLQTGDTSQARLDYESLLAANNNTVIAHNNLAWIYGEKELAKAWPLERGLMS